MAFKDLLPAWIDPVFLVDGSSFIHRAFFASPEMTRSDGLAVNAVFTMLRLFLKLDREEEPKRLAFFMDGPGPNFRHEIFPQYKANRMGTPESLRGQFAPIKEFMEILGFRVEIAVGCEADDCIASLARRLSKEHKVVIVGSDKDLRQCLAENVVIWDPQAKGEQLLTLESFMREGGLKPEQWPDYQALTGDSIDNIPGLPGVGPKTAAHLLRRLGTLEEIAANRELLEPKESKKILPHLEEAFVYRRLTRLSTAMCMEISLEDMLRRPPDLDRLEDFLRRYEFRSLLRELEPLLRERAALSASDQLSLFSAPSLVMKAEIEKMEMLESGLLAQAMVGLAPAGRQSAVELTFFLPGPGESGSFDDGQTMRHISFSGDYETLVGELSRSRQVFCSDFKAILKSHPSFLMIPLGKIFDLALAGYLLNPEERDYSLQRLALSLGLLPEEHQPAELALRLGLMLWPRLENQGLMELYRGIEIPLAPVLFGMEKRGVALNRKVFEELLHKVRLRMDSLEKNIAELAGGPFNLRSSRQLSEVLFKRLGLKQADKTPGGEASTSQQVLEKLSGAHPVVSEILEFRRMEKLRSTYLEPLPRLLDENGRLHTTLRQIATATGRLSSSDPNLQNIPIRGEMGRQIRSAFTAAPGHSLVAGDYSQIELRVLAHLSQDQTLLQAFSEGADIHARTAQLLYDLPADQISPDQRRNAKTINFGLLYGMGPQKLAQELKISMNEAKRFIEIYFSRLDKLRRFYDQIELSAKQNGLVMTMAGRRRFLPDIQSANAQLQTAARRQAINTVIQGSAADIIKMAMIAVDADRELAALGAVMILQIHDELLLEVSQDKASEASRRLTEIMTSIEPGGIRLSVPLLVDCGYGASWAEAH